MAAEMKELECDFCSDHPKIVCWYECETFKADSRTIGLSYRGHTVELLSIERWAACRLCALLIEEMDLDALVDRVCEAHYGKRQGGSREAFRKHISYTYQLFFTNRIGESISKAWTQQEQIENAESESD